MKITVIAFLMFVIGALSGYLLSDGLRNESVMKEIELLSKDSFVFGSAQKADMLVQVYEKYEKSPLEGEDLLKKLMFLNYESLIFSDSLIFFDEKEFLLEKTETIKNILISDPISQCASLKVGSEILKCHETSIRGK